jgi:hypothetical protein
MEANRPDKSKIASWEYLPDKYTLLQYLTRNDIIKLGKCCKRYREQFERQIYNSLSLTSWLYSNKKIKEEMMHSGVYDKLLRILEEDMGNKLKLVEKFIFINIFRLDLASKILNLLPNVNFIEFSHSYTNRFEDESISFIYDRQNLEHIKFIEYHKNHNTLLNNGVVLPKSLKSLRVQFHPLSIYALPHFNSIDSSYTNLRVLDIPTSEMLENLTSTMPNLKEVGMLQLWGVYQSSVLNFIKINPQLEKLRLYRVTFEKLVQTVLSLKHLTHLAIFKESYDIDDNIEYPANYSIKKLSFDSEYFGAKAIKIINSCKNLEILDTHKWNTYEFRHTKWSELKQNIKTLYFSYDSVDFTNNGTYSSIFKTLDELQLFDQVIMSLKRFSKEVDDFCFYKLKNYKVVLSINDDPKTITMVKIKQ